MVRDKLKISALTFLPFCCYLCAAFELLGLASLLPVGTALFEGGKPHLGIASIILELLGVQELSVRNLMLLATIEMTLKGWRYHWLTFKLYSRILLSPIALNPI
jgi:hypothetical protein